MAKQDGAPQITGFNYNEQVRIICAKAPCPPIKQVTLYNHVIKTGIGSGSGSVKYTATEIISQDRVGLVQETVLEVVDRTKRICENYVP